MKLFTPSDLALVSGALSEMKEMVQPAELACHLENVAIENNLKWLAHSVIYKGSP